MLFAIINTENGGCKFIVDELSPAPMAAHHIELLGKCIKLDDYLSEEIVKVPNQEGGEEDSQVSYLPLTDVEIVKILLKLYKIPPTAETEDLIETMEQLRSHDDADHQ